MIDSLVTGRQRPLESLITEKQKQQLETLLSSIMDNGYGELTIVIEKGQVRFFKPRLSIKAHFDKEDD